MRLTGKTAIVTGGASGLGRGIASRLAQEGARLAIVDRDGDGARAVAAELDLAGGQALAIEVDLREIQAIDGLVESVISSLGGVDILVNSAGVFQVAGIEATSEALWDLHMDINLKALFFMCRAVTPWMKEHRYGRIVNLTSIAGLGGFLDCPAYCASKGGIVNLTRALACELAPSGITVNAIAPGPVETPINDPFHWQDVRGDAHRRFLSERTPSGVSFYKVEDITGTALFLASDDAAAITGVTVPVDGGWTAW